LTDMLTDGVKANQAGAFEIIWSAPPISHSTAHLECAANFEFGDFRMCGGALVLVPGTQKPARTAHSNEGWNALL